MMGPPLSSPPDEPTTRADTVFGAIVGFCLGAAIVVGGLFMVVLMARSWWAEAKVYGWSEATATIVEARVLASPRADRDPFLSVRFRYDFAGRTYESDRVDGRSSIRDPDAYRLAELWQPGSTWPCYVDPRDPQVAVLRRDSLWWGFAVLFPLTFAGALGGLFLYASWASLRSGGDPKAAASVGAKRVVRRVALTLLFVSLVLTTYLFGVQPLLLFESARRWRPLPCTIISSRVRARGQAMSTRYSALIVFRYQLDGRERASGDYALAEESSRSFGDAAGIVRRYPPAAQATCFVDPRNPDRAVIDRSLPTGTPFALLPFGFLITMSWGLVASARGRTRRKLRDSEGTQ
jgi:hypothetical protein